MAAGPGGRRARRRLAALLALLPLAALALLWWWSSRPPGLPRGFVYLDTVAPGVEVDLRYAGTDNFLGRPVRGYEGGRAITTREVAEALARVAADLEAEGLGLRLFDAYRPQRAVDDFVRWSRDPADTVGKADYYPSYEKPALFEEGFIAARSGHSRGSAVDVTLVRRSASGPGVALDMGTRFDFFGASSHYDARDVPVEARARRLQLREAMLRRGFQPLDQEWWHFSLRDEPFPDRYFDFPVR